MNKGIERKRDREREREIGREREGESGRETGGERERVHCTEIEQPVEALLKGTLS